MTAAPADAARTRAASRPDSGFTARPEVGRARRTGPPQEEDG